MMKWPGMSSRVRYLTWGGVAVTAVVQIGTGLAYVFPSEPHNAALNPIEFWLPIPWWAVVWIAGGLLTIGGFWSGKCRKLGSAIAVGMLVLWAGSFGGTWVMHELGFIDGGGRSWVSAKNYLCLAALVWVTSSLTGIVTHQARVTAQLRHLVDAATRPEEHT